MNFTAIIDSIFFREYKPEYCKFKPKINKTNQLKGNKKPIVLVSNVFARNTTYKNLLAFLKYDKTEQIKYRHGFVCADFAQVLHNHAEKAGITAGWVAVEFMDGSTHACNVFPTQDKGFVFVDCTGCTEGVSHDTVVYLKKGEMYTQTPINNDGWEYVSLGTVKRYKIYW